MEVEEGDDWGDCADGDDGFGSGEDDGGGFGSGEGYGDESPSAEDHVSATCVVRRGSVYIVCLCKLV